MIIPYASHAPVHAVQQSSNLSCLIKSRAHWKASLSPSFFLNLFFECSAKCFKMSQNISKCSVCVATSCLCLFSCLVCSCCCSACDGLRMFLRGLSLTPCYWGGSGHGLLGHSGGEGWELYQAPDKAVGTNNWQVALETNQLICMSKEM